MDDKASKSFFDAFYKAYFFVMLLAITVLFSGGNFVRNLVEEKNSRIMEILLSSLKTSHLLIGKLIGLGALSIFQLFAWIVIFNFFFPDKLSGLASSNFFFIQIIYFLLGYFLYLSIFIGCGAFVNTEQGAQQISGYLSLLLVLPIIVSIIIIQTPDSLIAQILTYFPLTTAPLMLLKIGFYRPGLSEISITLALLVISILSSIFISAKIFRLTAIVDTNRFSVKKIFSMLTK
jgi:ABC-2 type transport system permease protein